MILKIGLAVKNLNGFQDLIDDFSIQSRLLTLSDINDPEFFTASLDIIIWQPEFSAGQFPDGLLKYMQNNQAVSLLVYNSNKKPLDLPDKIASRIISVIEGPLDNDALRILLYNSVLVRRADGTKIEDGLAGDFSEGPQLIGNSNGIKEIKEFINLISKSPYTPCLIQGEKGTEKYSIARIIHAKSKNAASPLQFIDCKYYKGKELPYRIFGRQAGQRSLEGALEQAGKGTLILQNIEVLDEETQKRLQAFLDSSTFRRVGGSKDLIFKVRIIATTTRDLEKFVLSGDFSKDLYFRLKAFELSIPPLRERKSDIMALAAYFISQYNQKFAHKVGGFSTEIEEKLLSYKWPGNISELRLVIERAVLLTHRGRIRAITLTDELESGHSEEYNTSLLGNCTLRDLERMHIEKVLIRTNGNKSKAAQILNISRTTLREKLRTFELNS